MQQSNTARKNASTQMGSVQQSTFLELLKGLHLQKGVVGVAAEIQRRFTSSVQLHCFLATFR